MNGVGLARGIFVGLRQRGGYDGDRRGGGGFVNGESGLLNVLRAGLLRPALGSWADGRAYRGCRRYAPYPRQNSRVVGPP